MTNLTGQACDDGAWAAFKYSLEETTQAGARNQMNGMNSMTFKKVGDKRYLVLIHAAANGPAIAAHEMTAFNRPVRTLPDPPH